jgi:hypothetical protein
MTDPAHPSAGDALPSGAVRIEVRVGGLRQLFNAMDPSPFRERDLDPAAEEFVVGWAREASRDAPLALLVHLDRGAGPPDEAVRLREAVSQFFIGRARITRQHLRRLLRRGRTSLVIGSITLAALITLANLIVRILGESAVALILSESLSIGGWVAMWRPMEIFLYDWWPLLADARLYDRLAAMPVRIVYADQAKGEAWRTDWPAVPASGPPGRETAEG